MSAEAFARLGEISSQYCVHQHGQIALTLADLKL
jgi:hypothetical protein